MSDFHNPWIRSRTGEFESILHCINWNFCHIKGHEKAAKTGKSKPPIPKILSRKAATARELITLKCQAGESEPNCRKSVQSKAKFAVEGSQP